MEPLCDGEEGKNDYPIRPIYLPDFSRPKDPATQNSTDVHNRVARLRQALRQRFGGRPGLVRAFRVLGGASADAVIHAGAFQDSLSKLNIHINEKEAALLIDQADAHGKGFLTFEDFQNLIFKTQPHREDIVAHHVLLRRVSRAQNIALNLKNTVPFVDGEGESCLVDFGKFRAALIAADPTLPDLAVEYLWKWQSPEAQNPAAANLNAQSHDGPPKLQVLDYRSFLARLAHFERDHQGPCPPYLQNPSVAAVFRRRLPGGDRMETAAKKPREPQVRLVGSQLTFSTAELDHKPEAVVEKSVNFVDRMRTRALRAKVAISRKLSESELDATLRNKAAAETLTAGSKAPDRVARSSVKAVLCDFSEEGDVDALLATAVADVDSRISAAALVRSVYHEQAALLRREPDDGLKKGQRKLRPERAPAMPSETTGAAEVAELLQYAVEATESGNGGHSRPIRLFRRLDIDGDGFLTMDDLRKAKLPMSEAQLNALHSALDCSRQGSVSLAEFSAAFAPFQLSVVDNLRRLQTTHFRATDVFRMRQNAWKGLPGYGGFCGYGGRFGYTAYPDTRHVTEPDTEIPNNAGFMDSTLRFRTTTHAATRWGALDSTSAQVQDANKSENTRSFRLHRARWHEETIKAQRQAGEHAAAEFDRERIARKALRKLDYEDRVKYQM